MERNSKKNGKAVGYSGWEDTLSKDIGERVWHRYRDVLVVLCGWNTECLGVTCES